MSKKIRLLALALAVLMIVPMIFAGCSKDDKKPENTTPAPQQTTTASSTDESKATEPTADPNKIDLEGYEFHLATNSYGGLTYNETNTHYGTAIYDELVDIYTTIEADLNCTIVAEPVTNDMETVLAACVGGIKVADFINGRQSTWIPLAMMNGLRPLESMIDAGLDLYNENNFNQVYTKMTEIDGHIWATDMTGKFDNVALGHYYAFNKELCEAAGYPADTLFQAVRDGKWDYNMMLEIARKITKDTDADGVYDIYGIALDCDGNEAWTNGTGPIVNKDGKWVANLLDPQLMPSLDFMYALSQPDMTIPVIGDTASRGQRRTNFYTGKAGFAGLYGGNFGDEFKEMAGNGNVGCLPIPKGPNADKYIMNLVDVDIFYCQAANQDWEKSAKVMNAIGSKVTSMADYRQQVLDACGGDEQSVEMLFDIALPNAMMNIAKCSDNMYQITRKGFYKAIYELTLTPAAAAEAYQDQVQAELDSIFKQK